jgi:hypothetical protein
MSAMIELTECTVCSRQQLSVPVSDPPLIILFCDFKRFAVFVRCPNTMYPLSYCYDKYCSTLHCGYFDGRKYKLENKIVIVPVQHPASFIPT